MAKDRDDELNTDLPDGEEFSLESILAEFGSGNSRKTVKEDTIPFPIVPKRGGGRPVPGGGRVVEFPGSRQAEPPEFRPDGPPAGQTSLPPWMWKTAPSSSPESRSSSQQVMKTCPPPMRLSTKACRRWSSSLSTSSSRRTGHSPVSW